MYKKPTKPENFSVNSKPGDDNNSKKKLEGNTSKNILSRLIGNKNEKPIKTPKKVKKNMPMLFTAIFTHESNDLKADKIIKFLNENLCLANKYKNQFCKYKIHHFKNNIEQQKEIAILASSKTVEIDCKGSIVDKKRQFTKKIKTIDPKKAKEMWTLLGITYSQYALFFIKDQTSKFPLLQKAENAYEKAKNCVVLDKPKQIEQIDAEKAAPYFH